MTYAKFRNTISELNFSSRSVPLVLFLLTILGFGLLIPFLGYYFDDWPVIWLTRTGANFWDFYLYDRPFSAWTYVVTTPILGTTPWHWHLFTLILRWLTTCLFWWVLKTIWPEQLKLVTWSALLFAVYPAFFQQPVAVAYSQHFTTYIFFLLSTGFMLQVFRRPRHRWIWLSLAILSQLMHVFTMEYFWGLELIRPVILWIVLSEICSEKRRRLVTTLKVWMPYLVVFLSAIFWRVLIYQPPIEDPNALAWLGLLRQDPFIAMVRLIEISLRDLLNVLVSTWFRVLQIDTISFDTLFSIGVWVLVIFAALGIYGYIHFFQNGYSEVQSRNQSRKGYIFLGFWSILCGFIPIWLTNRESVAGMYSDRFALAGIFGASILVVGIIDYFLADTNKKDIIISLLVGLAIGAQIRAANTYRWDWIYQQRFYWQYHWRVPELAPQTAIFSDGAIFGYVGDYPTAFALNVLQLEKRFSQVPEYWFFELDQKFAYFPKRFLKGTTISDSLRNVTFEGSSLESIVIDYDSKTGSCLWVVDQEDAWVLTLPALTRSALPLSDLSRISTDDSSLVLTIPEEIFGKEPEPYWCYYFQKASLARQNENWDAILELLQDVEKMGYEPQNAFEWIPFVDANLQLGNWMAAQDLTLRAYQDDPETAAAYCQLWQATFNQTPSSAPEYQYYETIYDQIGCYQLGF